MSCKYDNNAHALRKENQDGLGNKPIKAVTDKRFHLIKLCFGDPRWTIVDKVLRDICNRCVLRTPVICQGLLHACPLFQSTWDAVEVGNLAYANNACVSCFMIYRNTPLTSKCTPFERRVVYNCTSSFDFVIFWINSATYRSIFI